MKKLIITIIMGLMLFTFAFADEVKSAGELLKEYGIVNGNENGDLLEDELLNRAQMMKLLVDLYGDSEELDGKYIENLTFTDVDVDNWAATYIAYGQVNGLTSGVGDNKFNPDGKVTEQEAYKFLLNVLGYEVKWEETVNYANDLGIDTNIVNKKELKRSEIFELILKSLDIKMSGETVTLKQVLEIEENNVEKEYLQIEKAEIVGPKLLMLTIDEETDKADLSNVEIAIDDGNIEIESIKYSDWSNGIVLVNLLNGTIVGNKYLIQSGEFSAYFGGSESSDDEITIASISVVDFETIEVEFSDYVNISNTTINIIEKYGDNDVDIVDYSYLGNDKIEIKVNELKAATLYEIEISNLYDLSENKIDELTETFTGVEKDETKQGINKIEVKDANKIYVKFNVDYSEDALNKANYVVSQNYGDKENIIVNNVYQREEIVTDLNSDGDMDDISDIWVVLEFDNPTKAATLYTLEVDDITTIYGESLDSDEDGSTFTGKEVDNDGPTGIQITSVSYNEIDLVIEDDSYADNSFNISNISIEEKYGENILNVISVKEIVGTTITLITEPQKTATLYEATISEGLFDEFGNENDDEIIATFTGKEQCEKFDEISVLNEVEGKSLIVEFDQKYGDNYNEISNYFIDGGIGYPTKIEKIKLNDYAIRLIIAETELMKEYNITIENVENIDNVAMDKTEKSFRGIGNK